MPDLNATFPEDERQMIVRSLAVVARDSPGWHEYLRGIASARFKGGEMFDEFLEIYDEHMTRAEALDMLDHMTRTPADRRHGP